MKIDELNHVYQCWIIFTTIINVFKHCHRFIIVDDIHIKIFYFVIILNITTLNKNRKILLLNWILILSKSKKNWMYFLKDMRRFFSELTKEKIVIISDRTKKLKSTLNANFSKIAHNICCQNLTNNVRLKWSICRQTFWKTINVKMKKHFEMILK